MTLNERINAFHSLGDYLRNPDKTNRHSLLHEPRQFNPWFTPEQVELAIANVSRHLHTDRLNEWIAQYPTPKSVINVGVVMAGNIPLVGFHDLMSVVLAGHRLIAKPSSQDSWLITHLIQRLVLIEPRLEEQIILRDQLKDVDAVIATGSDNTARYFEYYFREIPHLIRRNRSSCAILTGSESPQDLNALGDDVFSYYGLGCRNVSKLWVPKGYDFRTLLDQWASHEKVIHHHKYANNYDYNKSILLVNRTPFLDNGFILITASKDIVSPISVLYFEEYENGTALRSRLSDASEKIQCIVGQPFNGLQVVPFGKAQLPELDDYADGVDTMQFLTGLG